MENFNLPESPVVFDRASHTYDLDGHQLSGVTAIVKWLFPDTYKNIPQYILDAAAEHGTLVHDSCELYDSMAIMPDNDALQHVRDYARLLEETGMKVRCSEYLVSDERYVASSIDKVFCDDSLADIKTTSKIHKLNVQVQLSIYAYLYEMQTGRKANRLYLIWLPKPQYGEAKVMELERICSEWCEATISRYAQGLDPMNSLAELAGMGFSQEPEKKRVEGEIPGDMQWVVEELMIVKKQLDIYSEREKQLKEALLTAMQSAGEDKWSSDLITISRRAASERVSIDTKALQKNEPAIWESYKKVSKVAESLTYKVL